jgi:starch synthase
MGRREHIMSQTQPFTTLPAIGPSSSPYVKASLLPFNSPNLPAEQAAEIHSAPLKLEVEEALRGAPLRILVVASEGVPYVKTGGPADVIGALPQALRRLGHDVRVVLPRYNSIDPERWQLAPVKTDLSVPIHHSIETVRVLQTPQDAAVPYYFIEAPHYFQREKLYGYTDDGDRFILFCRAALEFVRSIDWAPDIIHCHDWHTAIIPNWMKTIFKEGPLFASTATLYTIHNLAYQGIFGYRILEVAGIAEEGFIYPEVPELANVVDLMGRGILFADAVSTVSPRYASEILTPEFGERLDPILRERKDRLYGILNGIDTAEYNPATDTHLVSHYDAFSLDQRPMNKLALQERAKLPVDARIPLIGIISRLTDQKGFDLLDQIVIPLVEQGVQLIVSGTGDQHYHSMFQRLAARYPQQVSIHLTFNQEMSQKIYSGSDMLVMPSRFEPCGSTQMLAMRYGSIPVVHRTGGLADTVQDFDPINSSGNGFSFSRYHPFHLFAAIMRALEAYQFTDAWRDLMQRAMLADYSWDASAEQYVAVYRRAQELQRISATRG